MKIIMEYLTSCDNCGSSENLLSDDYICFGCAPRRKQLKEIIRVNDARIDAAYWRFCRMKQAAPPVLVVPDAYLLRNAARAELELLS